MKLMYNPKFDLLGFLVTLDNGLTLVLVDDINGAQIHRALTKEWELIDVY